MSHCKSLLATAATALCCVALCALAPLASARTTHHAHTACAARAHGHGHMVQRGCAARVHRTHPRAAHRTSSAPNRTASLAASDAEQRHQQEAAATIAQVLATPCQNTELTPEAGNLPLVRAAVLCLVNRERAQNGRTPLVSNPDLEQAAEGHCAELIEDDYFAHVSPSGETPVERIRATGYIPNPSVGYAIGENLAWGTYSLSTPQAIVAAWIASPGHLANILEAQYSETGIGVIPAVPSSLAEGESGATYAQEFGTIIE